jgi:hypothetical protein
VNVTTEGPSGKVGGAFDSNRTTPTRSDADASARNAATRGSAGDSGVSVTTTTSRAGVTTGGVVSRTTTWNDAVAEAPSPSTAVHPTVVVPSGKCEPEVCEHVGTSGPSCGSLADGSGTKLTSAPVASNASTICGPGTVIVGAAFVTVTEKDPAEPFPRLSVAEQLTAVAPLGNVEPDAGAHDTATPPSTRSFAEAL